MNNNGYYTGYQNTNIGTSSGYPNQQYAPTVGTTEFPIEQSYVENILRLNKGKKVTVHMTFPDSNEFRDREFVGIIEQSGRDHIILSDPNTGVWYLLLMIYVDFITFEEKINYSQEFVPNN